MANMSYCRFQNTVNDLADCEDYFDEQLGRDEHRARMKLYRMCKRIAEAHEEVDLANYAESEDEDVA